MFEYRGPSEHLDRVWRPVDPPMPVWVDWSVVWSLPGTARDCQQPLIVRAAGLGGGPDVQRDPATLVAWARTQTGHWLALLIDAHLHSPGPHLWLRHPAIVPGGAVTQREMSVVQWWEQQSPGDILRQIGEPMTWQNSEQ